MRRSLPAWLWDWLTGIQAHARPKGKCGVLVLKHPHQEDADALVVLSWGAWRDLHGAPDRSGVLRGMDADAEADGRAPTA